MSNYIFHNILFKFITIIIILNNFFYINKLILYFKTILLIMNILTISLNIMYCEIFHHTFIIF
jgi:hypothetical protein